MYFSRLECIDINLLFHLLNMCGICLNTSSANLYKNYDINLLFINIQYEMKTQDKTFFMRMVI